MKKLAILLALGAVAFTSLTAAQQVQKPSAYPAKNQSAEQQKADDSQCLAWAHQSTGIDPASVAAATPQATQPQGERLRGAARGAAGGAAMGEIASGDSSKGAEMGAAAGILAGGARARHNRTAQAQQTQAAKAQQMDHYYHAYGACMQGRGYSVN